MTKTALQKALLGKLLRDVSRSFYLTLRVLPGEIRPQVALAYLLARASDTIADTRGLPPAKRVVALRALREQFATGKDFAKAADRHIWVAVLENQSSPAEKELLEKMDKCFSLLLSFDGDDQKRISELLVTIIGGQIFDLETFPGETDREIVALQTAHQLDHYTYAVAGCVGEFWTKLCVAHFGELRHWDINTMMQLGVRFGKGLQLTNILRDLPHDLRIGRCYLPQTELAAAGLRAEDLLDARNTARLRPLYDGYLAHARAHLEAGWQYTLNIPATLWRLRLACALPIFIGLKTLRLLRRSDEILNPTKRIKVPRSQVWLLTTRTFLICRSDKVLDRYFRKLKTTQ